jgi:hypothetical protein
VTFYTGADASPKTGNTGSILNAQNEQVYYQITGDSELPLGTYKLFIRAKDSAQVADDLRMFVYNETDTAEIASVTKTLTGSWAFYEIDVTFDSADVGDNISVKFYKDTATANTIDVDYALWVPISSTTGNFPKDVAHQAIVDQNLRRELVGRE